MNHHHVDDTAEAFDRVAPTYDGPQGNNDLIQRMRSITWRRIESVFGSGARLIDIGCGTGIDAEHFAGEGFRVHATDWSPAMAERAAVRAANPALGGRLSAEHVGAQELGVLAVRGERFDGAYSNFGPLNCVPDLRTTSAALGEMMAPGARCVFTVIGRVCPWEMAHYAVRGRFRRLAVRFARGETPVHMAGGTIWTRYYTPRQFAQCFAGEFRVVRYEALSLFVPPPYLTFVHDHAPRLFDVLVRLDAATARWPLLRDAGDHFLIELARR
jgi:ubiquinone/menaquinone biosynthesis C-methylase UbiE